MSFLNAKRGAAERTTVLVIGGTGSAECVRQIEAALRAVPGVESASVNLLTRLSTIRHAASVSPDSLTAAVDAMGCRATLATPHASCANDDLLSDTLALMASRKARFFASAAITILLFLVNSAHFGAQWKLLLLSLLATPVQIAVGWEFYADFFSALRRRRFNLNSLVVLASSAAYLQGMLCFLGEVTDDRELANWVPQFHSAALILTVVSLGKWLEAVARGSAENIWMDLEALLPREACVLRDEREQIIPAGAVAAGDVVLVAPGERVPVDGEVLEGYSHIAESPLSGELQSISKMKGDRVVAASLNGSGFLRVRAAGLGPQSTLAHISQLVERARTGNGRAELFVDRIAAILVPATALIAVAAFLTWHFGAVALSWLPDAGAGLKTGALSFLFKEAAFTRSLRPALAVLVTACPCVLSLATPLALLFAMRIMSLRGVVLNGAGALESAADISDVVFVQRGTLAGGTLRVSEIFAAPDMTQEAVLALAGSLGLHSKLEGARGIEREARRRSLAVPIVSDPETRRGGIVQGRIGEREYLLCSRDDLREIRASQTDALFNRVRDAEARGASALFLGEPGGRLLGAIVLHERVKAGAAKGIQALRERGIAVHLLSAESIAQSRLMGKACGLSESEIHSLADTESKAQFIRGLKESGRRVAAIGVGAGDSPALAAADLAIALGAGAPADAAAVVVLNGDVGHLSSVFELSRRATRIIRQNIFAVLAITAVTVPLAFVDRLSPMAGAVTLAASSAVVALNALRLSRACAEGVSQPAAPFQPAELAALRQA